MEKTRSAMMRQIFSIPALMREMNDALEEQIKGLVETMDCTKYRKVILTGCGDSLAVGMAVQYAFLTYTNWDVAVVTAIDLSRYYPKRMFDAESETLVVAISNSGNVSRIIEAVKRVRRAGGDVLAITGNMESQVAMCSSYVLHLNIPKFDYAPGVRSYCGCLLAAYKLALILGQEQKQITAAKGQEINRELCDIPDVLDQYMKAWEWEAYRQAERLKDSSGFELVGAGYNYANAWFGYAKSLETTGRHTSALNTEDWFHMNYFVKDVYHTGTIAIANCESADYTRMEEFMETAVPMGRRLLFITDNPELAAEDKIVTPRCQHQLLHLFVQYLPISMLFSQIGDLLGEVYFRDGKDNWTACVGFATVAGSREVIKE